MRDKEIGDVLVTRGDRLVGIVTDRDLMVRPQPTGLDPQTNADRLLRQPELVVVEAGDDVGTPSRPCASAPSAAFPWSMAMSSSASSPSATWRANGTPIDVGGDQQRASRTIRRSRPDDPAHEQTMTFDTTATRTRGFRRDPVTVDIATQPIVEHEKAVWMLRSTAS